MAFKLKEIELEDGSKIPIKLDKESGEFSARYDTEFFKSEKLEEVEKQIREYYGKNGKLEFKPYILVEPQDEWANEDGFEYDRYFLAEKKDGTYLVKEFNVDTDVGIPEGFNDWKDCPKGHIGSMSWKKIDSKDKLIPYTPERWAAIRLIEKKLEELKQKLSDILTGDDSEAFLKKIEEQQVQMLEFKE